jgi:hypothetical protein
VILPYELPTATAIIMRQETIDNANKDVETRLIWLGVIRPAVVGETGDGFQIGAAGECFSNFILLMCISMFSTIRPVE